jgi:hypothetical protein
VKELTYTLEERYAYKGSNIDESQKPAYLMKDSEGFIVGIFSNKLEAEQAWPRIKYNLQKTTKQVNLRYATFKNVRPVQYSYHNKKKPYTGRK